MSKLVAPKDRVRCSHGRHAKGCSGERDGRHMKAVRLRCTKRGHVRGCDGASDPRHAKLSRAESQQQRREIERSRRRSQSQQDRRKREQSDSQISPLMSQKRAATGEKAGGGKATHGGTGEGTSKGGQTPLYGNLRPEQVPPEKFELLQAGRLSQTCPDCGRTEAAGFHCSGCFAGMSPEFWAARTVA